MTPIQSRLRLGLALASVVISGVAVSAQSPKPVLENERVRVIRVDLAKDDTLPNDNRYDVITLRLKDGQTAVVEPGQMRKADKTPLQQSHYFVAGTRRAVKNIGKESLPFVQVQFLRPQGKYVGIDVPPLHYCNPGSENACVTEQYLFCTDRFCAETVTMDPGAISTQHTHDADYLVIATSDFHWQNKPVGKSASQEDFKIGDVKYIEAGGSHQLINNGNTAAQLFVVQFK